MREFNKQNNISGTCTIASGRNIKNRAKNRSRAGFTITEVLLVVAILVVLFAVTIIGISSYQASLRQKELDSKAEVIYMAAQNRLTELAAAGRSDMYKPTSTTKTTGSKTVSIIRDDVVKLDVTPVDHENWETGQSVDDLYYVKKNTASKDTGDSTAANIVPENRVEAEILDNNWVIEYNPSGASVYAVFYSEESMDYTPDGYNSLRYRAQRLRQGAKIGYYGGDFVATIDTSKLEPHITIRNEERLYANIFCVSSDSTLQFEITVSDEFNNSWKKTVSTSQMKKANGGYTYDLELDNLNDGKRFKDVYGGTNMNDGTGGGLIPGSDITIKVVAKCNDDTIDDAEVSATTNSLFASVEDVPGTNGQAGYKQAVISYARHLQNLDTNSGVTQLASKGKDEIITAAIQNQSIHFENDQMNNDDWGALYAANGVTFTPIDNKYLDSYTGSYSVNTGDSVSTARNIICGLETTGGLFDTFYGSTLKDISLAGTSISGKSFEYAGGLCAKTSGDKSLTITGCRVYLDEAEGDLVGKDEKDVWVTATKGAGGLIGQAKGEVTFKESFAASVVGSNKDANAGSYTTEYAGGLIGYVASGATIVIRNSYADCYLYGDKVGGLIGGSGSGNIHVQSSYAAGYIYASTEAAGFSPATLDSATYAYSVMNISKASDTSADITSYATAKKYSKATESLYYLGSVSKHLDSEEPVNYTALSNKANFIKTKLSSNVFSSETGGDNTQAYNLMKQGLTDYSFPKINGVPHYGDWQASFESGKPVYYEKYEDSEGNITYGISGANMESLKSSGSAIGDGYGVAYDKEPQTGITVKYKSDNGTENTATVDPTNTAVKISDNLWILPLPTEAVNTEYAPDDFYQEIKIDEVTYYYNPHFAKTITSSKPSSVNSTIYVRTARQLYDMSLYYDSYAQSTKKCTYMQELDIDYESYDWTKYANETSAITSQNPIGTGAGLAFLATYNGKDNNGSVHTITGVSFVNTSKNSYYAGMFGDNQGSLRNIFIVWDYKGNDKDKTVSETALIEGSSAVAYMGCLAGKNTNKIENCGVAGYYFTSHTYENSTTYVGGLVGLNAGTILASYADTPKFTLTANYATVRMGGFVGKNTSQIKNCYASGAIKVEKSDQGVVRVGGFYGENSGTINGAYCTTAIITQGSAQGSGFGPAGGTLTNAYYLTDGSYFYTEDLKSYNLTAGDTRAIAVSVSDLKKFNLTGSKVNLAGFAAAQSSSYNTKTVANDSGTFPYPAVAVGNDGKYIHYGNWVTAAQMGEVGVFYWEYEDGGANSGYHFHFIGTSNGKQTSSTSLCTSHDDGGIITDYGYGYYLKKDENGNEIGSVTVTTKNFAGVNFTNREEEISGDIEKQLTDYKIYAYKTGTGSNQLYIDQNAANGTWTLAYTSSSASGSGTTTNNYTYTICPFFGNSFAYGTTTLGQDGSEYEIRSAAQLQYINWNYNKKNATSAVQSTSKNYEDKFTYLKYVTGTSAKTTGWNYYWSQTHDVDQQGKTGDSSTYFTPIGSMFYDGEKNTNRAYIAYFAGVYNGNTYAIKNMEIHSDYDMTGVFGITAGAKLENIILYSEKNNMIEITDQSTKWYCVGGLVGFAAEGNSNAVINNCTVSGYQIKDSRSDGGDWGGGSIGGLAGACNMKITNCTAINNITVAFTYSEGFNNVRVGGLVGNLRGTVDSCYSGGKIQSTASIYKNYSYRSYLDYGSGTDTSIWVGGISGGIVMIDYGDLQNLVGSTTGEVTISNSYSYVEMPVSGTDKNHVRDSQSIASIGEMTDTNFGNVDKPYLKIYNCYAYKDNVTNTNDYKKIVNSNGTENATYYNGTGNVSESNYQNVTRYVKINNKVSIATNGKTVTKTFSPYVSYNDLRAASETSNGSVDYNSTNSVIDLLNANWTSSGYDGKGSFGFVTTTENGAIINGKYSFPGTTNLKGRNYPFPTILTQKDTFGNTVNVHYGEWPDGTISWSGGGRLDFDMIENYDATTKSAKYTIMLKAPSANSSDDISYTYMDVGDDTSLGDNAKIKVKSTTMTQEGVYNVVIEAVKAGTQRVKAQLADGSDELWVTPSVAMNLIADPEELNIDVGNDVELYLNVKSASYDPNDSTKGMDLTEKVTWTLTFDDENFATVSAQAYDSNTDKYKVTVQGDNAGSTTLRATATYKLDLGGDKPEEFSETIQIQVNVTDPNASSGDSGGDSSSGS